MIGYKLAVGVCKDEGFFPVLVRLEIPEDADIVKPTTPGFTMKNPANFNLSDAINFSLSGEDTTISFSKYRTNKCNVLNVYALDGKECPNWNKVGYSLYEIIQYVRWGFEGITEYYEKESLESYLNLDTRVSCGHGIHFFETEYIAKAYYFEDENQWFATGIDRLNKELVELSSYYKALEAGKTKPYFVNHMPEILYKKYTGATDISCFSE